MAASSPNAYPDNPMMPLLDLKKRVDFKDSESRSELNGAKAPLTDKDVDVEKIYSVDFTDSESRSGHNGAEAPLTDNDVDVEKICNLFKTEIENKSVTVYEDIDFRGKSDDNRKYLETIGTFIDAEISNVGFFMDKATAPKRTYWHWEFVWAVLFAKRDRAYQALRETKDRIATALIGSHLSKGLGDLAESEREFGLAKDAHNHAIELERIAVSMIDECYQRDNVVAVKLVIRKLDAWQCGGRATSLLSLAYDMRCEEFLGTTSCQARLDQVWKGYFISTPIWMMMVGLVFPFVICFAPKAKNSSIRKRNKNKVKDKQDGCCPKLCAESKSSEVDPWHPSAKNCFGRGFGEDRWFFLTPLTFFYTTPMVKFFFYAISSVIFLFLFSFFMLTNFRPRSEQEISTVEYVVWAWALSTFIEELRQMSKSIRHHFSNEWNWMDLIIHALLLLSVILRYSLSSSDFVWARRSYSLALYLCFLRLLNIFYVWETIGPKVIMIRRMMKDILRFMLIMLVFLLAYGVTVQALRYPNTPASSSILLDIIYRPYWNIFGELFENDGKILGGGEDGGCTYNTTLHLSAPDKFPRCAHDSWLAVVLLAFYMILVNVLLLNLLIGMFSSTFEHVENNAKRIWKYYRYELVTEYYDKPALVPPLIIFSILWKVVLCLKNKKTKNTPFCTTIKLTETDLEKLPADEASPSTCPQKETAIDGCTIRRELEELKKMVKQLIDGAKDQNAP